MHLLMQAVRMLSFVVVSVQKENPPLTLRQQVQDHKTSRSRYHVTDGINAGMNPTSQSTHPVSPRSVPVILLIVVALTYGWSSGTRLPM